MSVKEAVAATKKVMALSKEELMALLAKHCECRPGSPDTCPKCTDMETGEKYADQDVAD